MKPRLRKMLSRCKVIFASVDNWMFVLSFVLTICLVDACTGTADANRDTIGTETFYGWPITWRSTSAGGGGLYFGPFSVWVPMLDWMLLVVPFVVACAIARSVRDGLPFFRRALALLARMEKRILIWWNCLLLGALAFVCAGGGRLIDRLFYSN